MVAYSSIKTRRLIKRSSEIENFIFFYKNRVFGGSFDNFSIIFPKLFCPISPKIMNKKAKKIIKRSSQIANFIFFYKNHEFGGSFDNFSKKISNFYNEFIKSSSEVPICVFVDAIFNFLEDHFISLRDFLICISSKKTSKIAAFIVRRFKKNEWCEHKRAVRKKRAFCDASR